MRPRPDPDLNAWKQDPFQIIHRLPHGEYSIAGRYTPASIKDQMVRAVTLIDRAYTYGILRNPKRLLVVGAGAAGASAAFRACDHEIATTLVEMNEYPFLRQKRSSRIVDPTEYDWPSPHWQNESVADLPLYFRRSKASELAIEWQREYADRLARNEFLKVREKTKFVRALALPDGRFAALFEDSGGGGGSSSQTWEEFDFVLNCTGPGEEQVSLRGHRHASFAFWADDYLEAEGFGLDTPLASPRVLISGGGDGALQDFLRIAYPKKTPRDIYPALIPDENLRLQVEWSVLAAEDAFRRAWLWSNDRGLDCQALQMLHRRYVEIAKMTAVQLRRLGVAHGADLNRLKHVKVCHACEHFSVCYPFNRFLALLVNELVGGNHFVGGRHLHAVKSAMDDRDCHSAAHCWRHPHMVEFSKSHCGVSPSVLSASAQEYDLVVIRHGPKGDSRDLARQMLPYDLPWKVEKH